MPSKLDPHIAAIEAWLAEQPQLTALAIVGRLREKSPEEFGKRQHSIVQRLLRALRRRATERLVAQGPLDDAATAAPLRGVVGGSGYVGPDLTTAPLVEQAGKAVWRDRLIDIGSSSGNGAITVTFADAAGSDSKDGERPNKVGAAVRRSSIMGPVLTLGGHDHADSSSASRKLNLLARTCLYRDPVSTA
ncbi:hypothetical protein GPL17_35895 [Bradyrhizobium yuanmingense]|uniref:hypothetical protein n=1 Tax=Bradyrhizobium yuanmingense TaxID=108015 RepID=UPI0012FBDA98|nr:hypothetical protein [Bradyrhizobium yuanmingense]MVT55784.1 hypothetical protein [Bradyrhizobium yuanmingense]